MSLYRLSVNGYSYGHFKITIVQFELEKQCDLTGLRKRVFVICAVSFQFIKLGKIKHHRLLKERPYSGKVFKEVIFCGALLILHLQHR